MTTRPTLVIGYGNRRRGDDAAGPLTLDRLAAMGLSDVVLDEWSGDGAALLDRWEAADDVVLVDALRSGRRPGHVVTLEANELDASSGLRTVSSHGVGLSEAVGLARALGRLPRRLWIVGIEGERFDLGAPTSAAVVAGTEIAARLVAERWGGVECTS